MIKKVCNERGIFLKHLIIGGGICICICLLLLLSSFITDTIFIGLVSLVVFCCLFVFYEPRLKRAELGLNRLIFDLSKQVDVLNSKQISGDMSFECVLPNIVSGNDPDTITDPSINLVIEAMGKSDLAWCYLESIVKDSKLSDNEVKDKINGLINHGYVTELKLNNIKAYGLSSKGQAEFHKLIT